MENLKEELKMKILSLLRTSPVPMTRGQIANTLRVPYEWIDKILRKDLVNEVREIQISPSRIGFVVR